MNWHQLINSKEDFQLIDVREPDEHDEFNIGGTLIPLGDIVQNTFMRLKKKNR